MKAVPINPLLDVPYTEPEPSSLWGRSLGVSLKPASQSQPPPLLSPLHSGSLRSLRSLVLSFYFRSPVIVTNTLSLTLFRNSELAKPEPCSHDEKLLPSSERGRSSTLSEWNQLLIQPGMFHSELFSRSFLSGHKDDVRNFCQMQSQ